jgi:hypothetical protein
MNNEPVAWMSQGGDVSRSKDYFEEMGFKDLIPLYIHPAKTLTDEEIKEAKREALKEYYSVLSYQDEFELSWIDELFARAILKKASEK